MKHCEIKLTLATEMIEEIITGTDQQRESLLEKQMSLRESVKHSLLYDKENQEYQPEFVGIIIKKWVSIVIDPF